MEIAMTRKVETLTEEQHEAYNDIQEFLLSSGGGMHCLEGYAGTGKTYLTSAVIEHYLAAYRGKQVGMSAPTNKAVRVLERLSGIDHSDVHFATIHSLLGLREHIDRYGNISFKPDRMAFQKIVELQFLIIDEVSMLNDELFDMLERYCDNGLKILFIGDGFQIPPIGKDSCIPLDAGMRRDLNIGYSQLVNIVRQAEGNPIIEVTKKIRDNVERPVTFAVRDSIVSDDVGVMFLTEQDEIEHLLESKFSSDKFKWDSDYCKVVAWTNKTVDAYNVKIRNMLYDFPEDKLVVGERLLANTPILDYNDEQTILFSTNMEFTVINYEIRSKEIPGIEEPLNYYNCLVNCHERGKEIYIRVLHENSQEAYNEILDALKKYALNLASSNQRGAAAGAWKEYYGMMRSFADVKYNYAITGHKSQGSTYDTCIVVEKDIDYNRKVSERNRIKYTACSRPSKMLIII